MSRKKTNTFNYNPEISRFANNCIMLRVEAGMTLKQLEEKIELSGGAWTKYEKGQVEPLQKTAVKIAEFFQVSVRWLEKGETGTIVDTRRASGLSLLESFERYVKMRSKDFALGDDEERLDVGYIFEAMVGLVLNEEERKKNLRRLRRTMEGLRETEELVH